MECGETIGNVDGTWAIQIDPGPPCDPHECDVIQLTIDGRAARPPVYFQSGGPIPSWPDSPCGVAGEWWSMDQGIGLERP